MAMSYSEYATQENPVKMPDVLVDKMWYTLGHKIVLSKAPEDFITQVKLAGLPYDYVLKGNNPVVWTTDHHGNPKSRSCFTLKL